MASRTNNPTEKLINEIWELVTQRLSELPPVDASQFSSIPIKLKDNLQATSVLEDMVILLFIQLVEIRWLYHLFDIDSTGLDDCLKRGLRTTLWNVNRSRSEAPQMLSDDKIDFLDVCKRILESRAEGYEMRRLQEIYQATLRQLIRTAEMQ